MEFQHWKQESDHTFVMSPAVVPRMDQVYSIVQKIYGRSPTDDVNDLAKNNATSRYKQQIILNEIFG